MLKYMGNERISDYMDGTSSDDGVVELGGSETAEEIEQKIEGKVTLPKEISNEEREKFAGTLRLAEDMLAKDREKEVEEIGKSLAVVIKESLKKENGMTEELCSKIVGFVDVKQGIKEFAEKILDADRAEQHLDIVIATQLNKESAVGNKAVVSKGEPAKLKTK